MKRILLGLLLSIGIQVLTQHSAVAKVQTRISDDGSVLTIQIDGARNGKKIHYDQRFEVAGMNLLQKEILKYRVFSSVGAPLPLNQIAWVIGLAFGLITLVITLLIVRFQMKRTPLLS